MSKPKVAFYWCSSCGGCEEAVVDLNEDVLTVTNAVDIVFWPVALDFKYADVEAMADKEITVSFINGAIRADDQLEAVQLLRRKSQLVVAFGSCAHMGGIPGLANFKDRDDILRRVYLEAPSVDNPDGTMPAKTTMLGDHRLTLPGFWEQVKRLDEVIDVDYYLPGCPPQPNTIMDAVNAILTGKLPERGAVLSPDKALCSECSRRDGRPEKLMLTQINRIHMVDVAEDQCFLEKGVVRLGPATRAGCGEKCMSGNMPCRGCYGPCDGVEDHGAAFLSALGSMVDSSSKAQVERLFSTFPVVAGTVYRFSLPASLAHRAGLLNKKGGQA